MTTPLSPAAQAVLDAIWKVPILLNDQQERIALAAAIRAAADQVVPDDPKEAMHFTTEAIRLNRQGIRNKFLAIATELENHP